MEKAFYEHINKASHDYPHMEFNKENLTYFSHFHNEIEIVYFSEGKISIVYDNKKVEGSSGDIFIFMPHQIHSFISTEPNKYHLVKLYCENERDKTDMSKLRVAENPIKRDGKLYTFLKKRFDEFQEEYFSDNNGKTYFLNSLANKTVGEILRYGDILTADKKEDKRSKLYSELLLKVAEFIEKNYNEKLTIADIAEHCGLSEYYFAHTFKNITGLTFFEYLTVFRLKKAIDIYLTEDVPITDAAFACGFSNIRSFYRLFKKHFLVTPKDYINKMKMQQHNATRLSEM